MWKGGQDIMNTEIYIGLIVILALVVITINTIIITHTWKASIEQKREQAKIQEQYYLSSMDVKVEDIDILDKIIDQAFIRYQILKLGHIDNLYITEEMERDMIFNLSKTVMETVSDNIINKLSLIYKKDYIDDIIVQKIQYVVMQFVIDINGNYKNEKK